MAELRPLIDKLKEDRILSHDEFVRMFTCRNPEDSEYLRSLAQETAVANYGHDILIVTDICPLVSLITNLDPKPPSRPPWIQTR